MRVRVLPGLLLALPVLASGCQHEPPPHRPSVPLILGQEPPALVLHEAALDDADALQSLFEGLEVLGSEADVLAMVGQVAASFQPETLQKSAAARRFTLHAVYRMVRSPGFDRRFDAVRKLVDALHRAAPQTPEAAFARAFLRWVLVADAEGRLRQPEGLSRDIVEDLERDLRKLVEEHPEFRGPGPFEPPRVRHELAQVQALLAAWSAEAPAAATPTDTPAAATPNDEQP